MIINFPRNVNIDINNIPEDFDDMIWKSFAEYTEGTAEEYMYQDKLLYIDLCRKYLHKALNDHTSVGNLIKEVFSDTFDVHGEIMDTSEFFDVGFMTHCFNAGRTNLYDHYVEDRKDNDKILELLFRAIKVVINF